MHHRTDGELVAASLKGDRQAGQELLQRSYTHVWQSLCRYIRANCIYLYSDARDIVSAAFNIAYEKMFKFDPQKGEFEFWVAGIAKKICFQTAKKNKKELPFDFTEELERQLVNGGKVNHLQKGTDLALLSSSYERLFFNTQSTFMNRPDEVLVKQEQNRHLIEALGQLREDYRNIIYDRIILEKPFKQIAAENNCSVDKVDSLFRRAIKEYKNIYEIISQ